MVAEYAEFERTQAKNEDLLRFLLTSKQIDEKVAVMKVKLFSYRPTPEMERRVLAVREATGLSVQQVLRQCMENGIASVENLWHNQLKSRKAAR